VECVDPMVNTEYVKTALYTLLRECERMGEIKQAQNSLHVNCTKYLV
jgi:hypothetical protein